MGAYKPSRPPGDYPASLHRAFEAVIGGQLGTRYETTLAFVPCGERVRYFRQLVSSFKATMRQYPLHRLHYIIPRTRTHLRVEPCGDGTDRIILGVELYNHPGAHVAAFLEKTSPKPVDGL